MYAKTSLVLKEPSFWHIHRRNFLRGIILAGGFLVVAISFVAINEYRWKSTSNIHVTVNAFSANNTHDNLAFVPAHDDVNGVTSSVRMSSFKADMSRQLERKYETQEGITEM